MSKLGNISAAFKLIHSLRSFNHYHKDIIKARETGGDAAEQKAIADSAVKWAKHVCDIFNVELHVNGRENIPEKDGFAVVSNHQGYADIIVLLAAFKGHQLGFIAKEELKKIPYLGKWIEIIRGVFLKRGNARDAVASFREGASLIKRGYNLAIFPEGTRSRGPAVADFKAGSFKLATLAKADIVPVTIDGTYKLYEETGNVTPGVTVNLTIHPAVSTATLDRKELRGLEGQVRKTIISALPEDEQKLANPPVSD